MADPMNIDTVESLSNLYKKVTEKLLRIDGVTFSSEKDLLNPIVKHLRELKFELDNKLFDQTKELIRVLKAYAHEKESRHKDELTQIPNRSAFEKQLKIALERHGTPAETVSLDDFAPDDTERPDKRKKITSNSKNYDALVFLDLDRFKGLNDKFGHLAGDKGLRKFAEIISQMIRKEDISIKSRRARLGGDEFAIIFHTNAENIEETKQNFKKIHFRIRKELAVCSCEYNKINFPLVSSCGMHVIEEGDTAKTVMTKADEALYKHKTGLDEHGRTKQQRYEYAVEQLEIQGVPNLQTVEDERASEELLKKIKKMGTALEAIIKGGGGVSMVVSPESAKMESVAEAIKILREHGFDLFANEHGIDLDEVLTPA